MFNDVCHNTEQRYFSNLTQMRQRSQPIMEGFIELVDLAIGEVRQWRPAELKETLRTLRNVLTEARFILNENKNAERQREDLLEIMTLRKTMLELKLELAIIHQNEDLADDLRGAITGMDKFFASAISDLLSPA